VIQGQHPVTVLPKDSRRVSPLLLLLMLLLPPHDYSFPLIEHFVEISGFLISHDIVVVKQHG
jgi:hypothetical protein